MNSWFGLSLRRHGTPQSEVAVRVATVIVALVLLVPGDVATGTQAGGVDAEVLSEWLTEGAQRRGLSIEEYEQAARFQDMELALAAYVRSRPDVFADLYWDWSDRPPGYVVLHTGATPPDVQRDTDVSVRFQQVSFSYTELQNVETAIKEFVRAGDPKDLGFVSLGVYPPTNSVRVTVTGPTAVLRDHVARYGDAVTVEFGEPAQVGHVTCTNRSDCRPQVRGATRLDRQQVHTQHWCSAGANARRPNGNLVHVIAGHCDINTAANHFHIDHHGAHFIGFSNKNGLWNGQDVDVLRIRTGAGSISVQPRNRFYRSDNNKSAALQRVRNNGGLTIGLDVAKSGVSTGTTWGEIASNREWYVMELGPFSYWFAHGWRTTNQVQGGDSGGPFWRIRTGDGGTFTELVGFASTQSPSGYFASQEDAKSVLGLSHFCITDAC